MVELSSDELALATQLLKVGAKGNIGESAFAIASEALWRSVVSHPSTAECLFEADEIFVFNGFNDDPPSAVINQEQVDFSFEEHKITIHKFIELA